MLLSIARATDKQPKLQPDFDLDKYLGGWYEIYRSKSARFEGDNLFESYRKEQPNQIQMNFMHKVNGINDQGTGVADIDPHSPARWSVTLRRYFFPRFIKFDYEVIETDYYNYAIVFSRNVFMGVVKSEFVWILSRHKTLDDKTVNHCFEVIERETGITRNELERAKQQ